MKITIILMMFFTLLNTQAKMHMRKGMNVEIHATLCEKDFAILLKKIKGTHSSESSRTVAYFDTADKSLFSKNVIVRVREKGTKSDLTVKIRSMKNFQDNIAVFGKNLKWKCEYDSNRQGISKSCSMKLKISQDVAEELLQGTTNMTEVLHPSQKKIIANNRVNLQNLKLLVYGPVKVQKVELINTELTEPWDVEFWQLDQQTQIGELSFRVRSSQLNLGKKVLHRYIQQKNIKLCPTDTSKTKFTLDFF